MHNAYMKLAIKEAKKGLNKTFTNPLVGAIIVKDNRVIATGAHLEYGQNHAERHAIEKCPTSEELFNSTLYVTLEPCNHFGKQPPCCQLIIDRGIKRVVVGQLDPNPLVAGKGIAFLEKNGIEVLVGIEEEKVRQLNTHYLFFHQFKRPYIALKQAITLDGRISIHNQRTRITGKEVWKKVHEERSQYQGILVGCQTVLIDNPNLLTLENLQFPPIRIVLDRQGRILLKKNLNLFTNQSAPVWIFTENKKNYSLPSHVTIIQMKKLTLELIIKELTQRQVQSIYVEGGGKIHDTFLANHYWDEIITYISPKIIGGNSLSSFSSDREVSQLIELENLMIESIGNDIRISGRRKSHCLLG